jgi:regulator of protease activity HflC (stomatin/prohibitin superfamily)
VSDFSSGLIVVGVVVLLALIVLLRTVRIVPQAFEGVVERLGRYSRTLPAGLHVLIPFLDHLRPFIDMREQVVTFPPQPVITEDNVTISIDVVIYYQITDAVRATYEVANLVLAMEQLSVTTLRNVIGSLSLEETLTSRDKINAELRIVMDDATEKWGVRVNRIELKSIDPPASIQEAMEKQMRAERSKRATVLEAEGEKQSQILRAEGDRQGAILRQRRRSSRRSSRPRAIARPRSCAQRARARRSRPCSPRSTRATRLPTCWPSSTSRRCRSSLRARPARFS